MMMFSWGWSVGLIEHATNQLSDATIGAAIEVHRHLGPGLLESSYHACLCRELELRGIRYESQVSLPLRYKGILLAQAYVVDLLIDNSLVVELKSVEKLLPIHSTQLLTYMRLQGASSGLLMNFNVHLLPNGIKRMLL
jgi:GxxExxY protein